MQYLKSIENSFEFMPIRLKVELFLLPLVLLIGIYFFFFSSSKQNYITFKPIDIKKIIMKKELIEVLNDIEKFALENEIYLEKISKSEKSLKIEIIGSLKKSLQMFTYLENYNEFSKIRSFEFLEDKVFIEVDFNKFYKKRSEDFSILLDEIKTQKQMEYKLTAIVGNRIFINDTWFKEGDSIGFFKVSKIEKQSVILKNRYKTVELNLREENE